MEESIIKALVATVLMGALILPAGCSAKNQSQPSRLETVSPSPSAVPTAAATSNETRIWNVTTVQEAEQITGYKVYSPAYIPDGFAPASKFMINTQGFGEYSRKVVTRLWMWKGNRDLLLQLTESPTYFEIGGGQPAEVNGRPGQRALQEKTADHPASVFFAWEQDGLYFSFGGSLKDPLSEQEILKIAASLQHLP